MHSKETDGSKIPDSLEGCDISRRDVKPIAPPPIRFGPISSDILWGESQGATAGKKKTEIPRDALSYQVGGNHYKDFAIQPVEFITRNKLSFLAGCIVKRICRYNRSGGKGLQDLEKIKHECELLIELAD